MVESQVIPSDPMSAALAEAGLKPKAETVKQPAPVAAPPPAAPPVAEKPTTLKEEIQSQLSEQTGAAKKAEEVKTEPTVTEVKESVFDEEKYLSGKLGGKFKSLAEVETSYNELDKKSKENPFANETIKGLNEYVKGGGNPEVYMGLQKLDLKKMSDRDKVVYQLMLEKDYSKEDAEALVNFEYKIGAELKDENDQEIPGVREAQLKLKGAAHDASKYLEKYKADNSVSPAQKELEARTQHWESYAPALAKEITSHALNFEGEDYSLPVSENAKIDAMKTVEEMVKSGTLDIDLSTPNGIAQGAELALGIAKAQDFDLVMQHVYDTLKTKMLAKEHHVRTPSGEREQVPTVDPDERLFNILSGAANGRRN